MPRTAPHSLRGAGILLLLATACAQILGVDDVVILPLGTAGQPPDLPAPACQPRELRCQGAALQICRSDQQGFRTARVCSTPELCCDDPARCPVDLGCQAPACAAGEFRCDGAVLSVCNDGQTGWAPMTTCPSAAQCNTSLGRCSDQPCNATLPDRQCSEAALLECRGGGWALVAQCESSGLCNNTGTGNDSDCRRTNCTDIRGDSELELPSPFKCDNGELLRCNDQQTEWELVETCLNLLHCNDLNDVLGDVRAAHLELADLEKLGCTPPACTPGKFRCEGSRLMRCNPNRTGYSTPVQDCGSASRCNASLGTCTPQDCIEGTTQCSGSEYQECTGGTWRLKETCAGAAQCDPRSGCRPATCEVTQYRCNGSALERCNVNGTDWIPIRTCQTAALCNEAAKRCDPPLCGDGDLRCSRDGKLERCSVGHDAWDTMSDCRSLALLPPETPPERVAASCDLTGEGRCNPTPRCVGGSRRCSGQYLERCENDSWQPVERCVSSAACDAGSGTCRPSACQPGEHRCVTPGASPRVAEPGELAPGLTLQVCDEAGTGFVNVRDCAADNYCDARHAQCDICTPLDPLCFGGSLYRCSGDGQERELEKACTSGCILAPAGTTRPSDRPSCAEDLTAP